MGSLGLGVTGTYEQGREPELGNAITAILISLLQTLVDKNVLSKAEARALLIKADRARGTGLVRRRCRDKNTSKWTSDAAPRCI